MVDNIYRTLAAHLDNCPADIPPPTRAWSCASCSASLPLKKRPSRSI
jgi:hypothetical protein